MTPRIMKFRRKFRDHSTVPHHMFYIPIFLALVGLMRGCVLAPSFHHVIDTREGEFIITRIHTERLPFEGQTHKEIHLTKLNPAGEPLWDMRTLNKEGSDHKMISDGDGGVIIAFMDIRGERRGSEDGAPFSPADLYIQRFDETGRPLWGTADVPLSVDAERRSTPHGIVADGAGGAIVVWDDAQAFYAQRIDASGQALWDTERLLVVGAEKSAYEASAVEDGAGGAFIVWRDSHTLYAQHLNAQGHPLWRENGIRLTSMAGNAGKAVVAADGRGLIVVWKKHVPAGVTQKGPSVQRFNAEGQPCWEQDVSLPGDLHWPSAPPGGVTPDGQGNVLISWGIGGVHVQKLDLEGRKLWNDDAIFSIERIEDLSHSITDIAAIPDDAGGAFVVWRVGESPVKGGQVYAQHLDTGGHPQWPGHGVLVYPQAAHYQGYPQIVSDHNGGVIVFSLLGKTLNRTEIYGQKIDAEGNLLWSEEGLRVRFE